MRFFVVPLVIAACCSFATAQETKPTPAPAVKWVNISDPIVAKAGGVERPGVMNLGVDPASGDVYLGYGKAGLWKSVDQGQTWELCDGGKYNSMGTCAYSCDFDPAGGRLVFWGMYGASVMTLDSGKTWKAFGFHRDWGTVDWSDPEAKTMWIGPHGEGSVFSFDGGKTWKKQPEDKITALGIFDSKTFAGLLVDAVFVSTEGGDNFVKKTRRIAPAPQTCMRVYKGVGYWVSNLGLIVSKDKGATWQVQGKPLKDPIAGPFFESEKHIVVVTREAFMETTDAGDTWTAVAPALGDPKWDEDRGETKGCRYFSWDPKHDVFYGGKLGSTAVKYARQK